MNLLDAAMAYADAGWYVGPLRHRDKNPGGLLGKDWETQTSRDPAVIRGWFVRHPNRGVFQHSGRSGAVTFDVDHAARLHPLLRRAFDEECPPQQGTRVDDPGRGHYLFRQPEGRDLGNSPGGLGGEWGEVRGRNGVIVVAPSEHKEDDGRYVWRRAGPVPVLPEYVAALLPDALDAESAVTDREVSAFLVDHLDGERFDLLDMQVQSWHRKVERGESRHSSMTGHLTGAMKEAAAGLYPAALAADTLESIFVQTVMQAGHGEQRDARSEAEAVEEWRGLLSWAVGQAKAADPVETLERAAKVRASAADDFADFFDQTDVLQHIRAAAHSRALSAPLLLVQVLARVLLEIPPGWMLPPIVGSAASLNLGFAVVGTSSAGKSTSGDVAEEVLGGLNQDSMIKPIGSGEGMIDAYFDVVKIGNKNYSELKTKPHCLFTADEVEQLNKLMERSGSTLGPILRSALTGGLLGNQNAAAGGRTRFLRKRVYRLMMIVAVQPALSGALLGGKDAGTPQRFLWLDGKDATLPDDPADLPDWPGALDWDVWWDLQVRTTTLSKRTVDYPADVKDQVVRAQLQSGSKRGDADPIRGHLMLTRLKVAAALAFLHQELDITDQWWVMAGELTDASMRVQDDCYGVLVAEAARRSNDKARQAGQSKVTESAATEVEQARRKRVSDRLLKIVDAAGAEGIIWSDARRKLRDNQRGAADQVRDLLAASGQIRIEEIDHHGQPGLRLLAR